MSLYSALYSGVSGLSAQSSAMAIVADNITNINTIGYKGVSAEFRTLVTDGRLGNSYSAGGVSAAPQAMISKQGVLQASASGMDLGIEGAGFFVTRSGSGPDADLAFTRAGSFKPDLEGYLRNTSGFYLQGWRLDAQGQPISTSNLEAVRVSELTGSAAATGRIQLRANLASDQVPHNPAAFTPAKTYTAGTMAEYATNPTSATAIQPHFTHTVDVYDAQGSVHTLKLSYLKTGANTWKGEIYAVPASDVTAAGGLLASGDVVFNPDGTLNRAGSSPALFDTLNVGWTNGAAAGPIQLELGSNGQLDGLSQFSGQSSRISSSEDGGLLGTIASVEISAEGKVSAIFSDGTAREVFQLPLATFQNPDGLTRLSGNAFITSGSSGNFAINAPGKLGGGNIKAGTLEASNVDLAQEFTNMIRFQRAYSASSKIITTVDDMLQELGNLKR
ncbi:flagellar hook protein FlgE [Novosphingobium sp. RD2P27]|uniref:Flagellar hook protein FlgE n=1 Tax=Novosphingobium kalidii TaxID=3230299 RepID=A0ABV2CXR9_9SPHN